MIVPSLFGEELSSDFFSKLLSFVGGDPLKLTIVVSRKPGYLGEYNLGITNVCDQGQYQPRLTRVGLNSFFGRTLPQTN
jgi:hypothetical protein